MADIVLDSNDSQYRAHRQDLTDGFTAWLADSGQDIEEIVGNVGMFLDWVTNFADGQLSRLRVADLEDFLLDWCPARLSAPPSIAPVLCTSLEQLIGYLAQTDRLRGGAAHQHQLTRWLAEHVGDVEAAMADTSRYGMAKSMLFGDDPDALNGIAPAESIEELERLVAQKVAEHNARPIEERRAATDRFFDQRLKPLPFSYTPPPSAAIEESAAAAPLLADIERLRDFLGESGRPLTKNGNLRIADGKALVELLGTNDKYDEAIGDRTFKTMSSRDMPGVTSIVDTATGAGAVRVLRGKLVPVKRWASLKPGERVRRCWDDAVEYGLLPGQRYYFRDIAEIDAIMEAGLAHWLLPLLPAGTQGEVDAITEQSHAIVTAQQQGSSYFSPEISLNRVDSDIDDLLRLTERLGMITWDGWTLRATNERLDIKNRFGGTITLTAIGRVIVSTLAEEAGFELRIRPSLADLDATELLNTLATEGGDPAAIAREWQLDVSMHARGLMVIEAMLSADNPLPQGNAAIRLYGFALLTEIGPAEFSLDVHDLLGTELGGHAALFLLENGLAASEDVGPLLTIAPVIDTLAVFSDSPAELLHHWERTLAVAGDADRLLADIGSYRAPESALVLDALGRTLPDKRLAKSARKELFRLRGRLGQN